MRHSQRECPSYFGVGRGLLSGLRYSAPATCASGHRLPHRLLPKYRRHNRLIVAPSRSWPNRNCVSPPKPLGDGQPSPDPARHTLQRSAPHCGSWSTTPSAGARETWFEECEGHYQDYLFRGGAKRLLGRTWVFPIRRNLTPLHTKPQSAPLIAKQCSSCTLVVPA